MKGYKGEILLKSYTNMAVSGEGFGNHQNDQEL